MKAVADLELSAALRVVGYVCHYLKVTDLKDHAYSESLRLVRQAPWATSAEEMAEIEAQSQSAPADGEQP